MDIILREIYKFPEDSWLPLLEMLYEGVKEEYNQEFLKADSTLVNLVKDTPSIIDNWLWSHYEAAIMKTAKNLRKKLYLIRAEIVGLRKDPEATTKVEDFEKRKIIAKSYDILLLCQSLGIEVKNNKALCPLHDEHTPSFSISTKHNVFHCFGCGVGGDTISLVMQIKKVGFLEAINFLVSLNGV